MKILEINTFNKVVGGVESYVFHMARALSDRGHEVVPLYLMAHEDHPGLMPAHAGYYMPDLTPHHTGQIMADLRSGHAADVRRRFREILDREQPDVVHCNNIYSPVYLREFFDRVPMVRTVHDYRFLCPNLLKLTARGQAVCTETMGLVCYRERCLHPLDHEGLRHLMMLRWEREVSKDFDRLITKSMHIKSQLVQAGVPDAKVAVVPLSVTLPEVPETSPLDRAFRPASVLFVGRVAPEKGCEILLRALARVAGAWDLWLAGDGPSMPAVRQLAAELGLNDRVTFHGWQGGETLQELYATCDFVAVPSIWPEPFGLVGLEAMAHAKPVVAFDVGGIPEWLDHEHSGLLVPVGDEEGLSAALARLIDDPELVLQLGINARREVESRFTMDIAAGKLLHVLENVVRL